MDNICNIYKRTWTDKDIHFWTNPLDNCVNASVMIDGVRTRLRAGIIIMKGDKILLAQEKDEPGVFSLPGGSINRNESLIQAAIREAQEEVGITATDVEWAGVDYCEFHDEVKDWVKTNVPESEWWYNYYTCLYIGEYKEPYKGEVADKDKDPVMKKSADFYDISEVINDPSFKSAWKEALYNFGYINDDYRDLNEKIVKKGSKWQVQSEKGRNLGTYDTKKEAEKRLKQVEYFKHLNEATKSNIFKLGTAGYILEDGSFLYAEEEEDYYHGGFEDDIVEAEYPEFSNTHAEEDTCIRLFKEPNNIQYKKLEEIIDKYLDTEMYTKIEIWKNGKYDFYKVFSLVEGACEDTSWDENIDNWTGYKLVQIIKNYFNHVNESLKEDVEKPDYSLNDIISIYSNLISDHYESCGNAFIMPDGNFILSGKVFPTHAHFIDDTIANLSATYKSGEWVEFDSNEFCDAFDLFRVNDGSKKAYEDRAYFVIEKRKVTLAQLDALKDFIDYIIDNKNTKHIDTLQGFVYKSHKMWNLTDDITSDDIIREVKRTIIRGFFTEKLNNNSSTKLLTEETRSQLLSKSKNSDMYSGSNDNRFTARSKVHVANTVKDYNKIDMNTFWKEDLLKFKVNVNGETNNYLVTVEFTNILPRLQKYVSNNKNELTRDLIYKALIDAIKSSDIKVDCECSDWKYRLKYFATKKGYNAGDAETRASNKTNPNDTKGAGCKHINAVLSNAEWLQKIASVINNYINYCKDNMQYNYGKFIFPKIYGMSYNKAQQMCLNDYDDEGNIKDRLESDEALINLSNALGKVRGRIQKGSNKNPVTQKNKDESLSLTESFNDPTDLERHFRSHCKKSEDLDLTLPLPNTAIPFIDTFNTKEEYKAGAEDFISNCHTGYVLYSKERSNDKSGVMFVKYRPYSYNNPNISVAGNPQLYEYVSYFKNVRTGKRVINTYMITTYSHIYNDMNNRNKNRETYPFKMSQAELNAHFTDSYDVMQENSFEQNIKNYFKK